MPWKVNECTVLSNAFTQKARRTPDDIARDRGFKGELRFSSIGSTPTAILTAQDDDYIWPIIPMLEHAELVYIEVNVMCFRGIERDLEGVATNRYGR